MPLVFGTGRFAWHSRHTRRTSCRISIFALAEPCGIWQLWQPSSRTGACSNVNGPRLSLWQLKQPGSLAFAILIRPGLKLPWGLWQSTHVIAFSGTRCLKGSANDDFTSMWQLSQRVLISARLRTTSPSGPCACIEWHDVQAMALRAWLASSRPEVVG